MVININKKILCSILIVFCLFSLTGCKKKTIPEEFAKLLSDKSGKVVKLGFYGSPDKLDPIKAAENEYDIMLCNLLFASPLRKTETGDYVPYLLENFEAKLDGDNLVVNGNWRQGLKWHDGVAFDSSEFEYNLEQMKLPKNNSPYLESAKDIIALKNDSNSIEIKFASNNRKYLDLLCAGLLPGHIFTKEKIASDSFENVYKNFIEKPIGLGPYKVIKNEKFKYFHLEPVADFFDGKGSKRPSIAIACSFELQQTISDFRENMYDWINVPSMIAEQLQNLGVENVEYIEYPNPAVMAWVFNSKNSKLSDVKVRKALNLIIDRETVSKVFGSGIDELYDNLIPITENKKSESENFDEGKKLLDEAGIKDNNNDGIRDFNGNNFKISILINNDSMTRKLIAEKMIDRLKSAGIDAEIESVSWNDFMSEKLKKGNFETALLSYHIGKDCSMKSLFSTKKEGDPDSLNFTGISDYDLDRNLTILDSAVTYENREKAFAIVNEKLSQYCPCAFLLRASNLGMVHGKTVKSLKAKVSFWDDIYNWKIMFGKEESKL